MADVIISDLPVIVSSTVDDFFIINDGNTTTAIISQANLFGSVNNLQTVGFADGSESTPSVRFTSDPNVGIYKPAPDSWAVSTNGVQRLVIDDAGRVGINQRTPASWFSGSNNLVIGDTSLGDNGMTIVSSTTEVGNISFADGTSNGNTRRGLIRYDHSDDHMRFDTSATEAMRIDEDGNVLVGVSSMTPGVRFSVEGGVIGTIDGTVSVPGYTFQDDTDTGVWRKADNTISIATDGSERLTVGPTGDVYLASDDNTYFSHPANDVIAITNNGAETVRFDANNNVQLSGSLPTIFTNENQLKFSVDADANGTDSLISFFVDGTSSAVITEDSLGIGTTDPSMPLDVRSEDAYVANFQSNNSNALIAFKGTSISDSLNNTIGFTGTEFTINVNGSERLRVDESGNVGIGTNDPQAPLDVDGNAIIKGNLNFTGAGTPGPELSTPAASTIALKPDGAVERIRIDESGAIGLSGANYGLDGQVLTSQGPGVSPSWVSIATGIPDISSLPDLP